jgi:DNA-binding CsgD family transcriptional regulator
MNISALELAPRAREVVLSDEELTVRLKDGRTVSVPLSWFPRLLNASPQQRSDFEFVGEGEGIHWPAVDEDLSVAGLLRGVKAPRGGNSSSRSGRLKIQRRGTLQDPLKALSAREYQVFSLVVGGIRTKEIAARLGVSPKTADTYRASMMRKLDIHDVAALKKFARRDRSLTTR